MQIQPVGIHLNGVAHLIARRLHELGRLVQHNIFKNCRVLGAERAGAFTVPAGGSSIAVFNGQGRCILACCIQRILQRFRLENGVVINIKIFTLVLVLLHPTAGRNGEGNGEGIAAEADAIRDNDIILVLFCPDQEQILQ